ncbi:MAG TPA: phosphatase PAP2 family protein [Jatrophihabitans sp.]|nr:phosphatase PAP2 family protein [Jatrophihabitans sp.]
MTAASAATPAFSRSWRWPTQRRSAATLLAGAVLVWLVVCGLGWLLAHPLTDHGFTRWEGGVDRFLAAHRSGGWNSVTNAASLAGDTPAAIGMSVLAFIVLRLSVHRWREPLMLAVAMLGEVAIFSSSTVVVGRHRPDVAHLDGSPPTSSFPSGHTAASTTLYGVLAIVALCYASRVLWRVLSVAAAVVIVLSIGTSRLYRGMHYPTDVAGGILLGLLWITVVSLVILRHHTPRSRDAAGDESRRAEAGRR